MSAQAASVGPPSAACAEFLTHCYPKGCAKTHGPRYRRCSLWRDRRTLTFGSGLETALRPQSPGGGGPPSPSLLEQWDATTPNTSKELQLLPKTPNGPGWPDLFAFTGEVGCWCACSLGRGRPKTSSICCASPASLPVGGRA